MIKWILRVLRIGNYTIKIRDYQVTDDEISKDEVKNEFIWCLVGNIVEKHFFGEEKMIKIPVRREELVIERKYLIPDEAGTDLRVESTRYVLREERLHYQVRPFDIQTVRIDKRSVQGFHPTEVTLKKEILALKSNEGIATGTVNG